MIERKKKICKTCQTPQFLWAYGNCKECHTKVKLQGTPKATKVYSTSTSQYKPVERSIPELVKLATITFNRWVKQRDTAGVGGNCISCGTWYPAKELQSGHYMPSTYTILKFNEDNVSIECEKCNCSDTNHLKFYRINLIKKIGLEKVLELENTPLATYHKWEREELYDIINRYK